MKKTLIVLVALLALVFTFAVAEECASHNWNPVKISEATCTSPAVYEEICSVCKASNGTFTQGSKAAHTAETVKGKAATCTETGLTDGSKCSVCGETLKAQEVIAATGHNYSKTLKTAATCTEKAVYTYSCPACGDSYEKAEGSLAEHHWVISEKEKDCETIEYTEKCSACSVVNQIWTKGSGKKHNWAIEIAPADCTTAKTYTETCTKCGAHDQTWTEGSALGHTEQIIPGKAATCTETGLTDKIVCSVCNVVIKDHEIIPMIPHTAVEVPAVPSTCVEHGKTAGSKCSVCGTVLTVGSELPLVAHNYEKNRVVEPTETKGGYTEYKCTVCGDWYRARRTAPLGVAVDAALSTYGEGIVTDLDDVAMPYTVELDEDLGLVIITATDIDVLRELHMSLDLIAQWKAEGMVAVEFVVDDAEIIIAFELLETEVMEEAKAGFPATLTGYIVTLDPTAVDANGAAGCLVKVDLTADTAEEDGIEMEVTNVIEGMKLTIGETAISVVGGGVYTA